MSVKYPFCNPCNNHGIEIRTKKLSPVEVIEGVCKFYKVDFSKVIGKGRYRNLVDARHIAMHLLRNDRYLNLSLASVGEYFNNRDHTTVIHAVRNVEDICYSNSFFREQVRECYLDVYKSLQYYNINLKTKT